MNIANTQFWKPLGTSDFTNLETDFKNTSQFPNIISTSVSTTNDTSISTLPTIDELIATTADKPSPIPDVTLSLVDMIDSFSDSVSVVPASVGSSFSSIMNAPKINISSIGDITQRMMIDKFPSMSEQIVNAVYNMVYGTDAVYNNVSQSLNYTLDSISNMMTETTKSKFAPMILDGSLVNFIKCFGSLSNMEVVANLSNNSFNNLIHIINTSLLPTISGIKIFDSIIKPA